MTDRPETERNGEPPIGFELEQLSRLEQLARAIALGEGFALYILLSPTPETTQTAIGSIEAEVMRLRQDTTSSFTLFLPSHVAHRQLTESGSALEALFDESKLAHPNSFLILDASSTTKDDEQTLRFLFERLNERRNQLIARRKLPLLLVLPLFAERLLVQVAPDLWSIRSLPAVVLAEQSQAASAIRSVPAQKDMFAAVRAVPLQIGLLYADQDRNFALDIERHLRMWSVEGLIRFVHHSPNADGEHNWANIHTSLVGADLIVVLASPELSDWFRMESWLLDDRMKEARVVPIIMRAAAWQLTSPSHWRTLPHDGRPLSLLRQNERDEVMLELSRVVRKLVERGRPLGPSWDVELLRAPQMPGTVRESEPTLTRAEVRKLLDQTLRTSADFDAFCIDHFENVFRRYSGGMSRIERTNLLLQLESPERIWGALRSYRDRHT